jgi:hypothetical protein
MELRKKDFRLGKIHGKTSPQKKCSEATVQRNLFLGQRITIVRKRDGRSNPVIRIFAYETPLEKVSRGMCIDLLGYDRDKNLYIFELKIEKSTEKLSEVNLQIKCYADKLEKIKKYIEQEFNEEFFFTMEFKEIKKIVVAPREFYRKNGDEYENDIEYLYYADPSVFKKDDIPPDVKLHVWKKRV